MQMSLICDNIMTRNRDFMEKRKIFKWFEVNKRNYEECIRKNHKGDKPGSSGRWNSRRECQRCGACCTFVIKCPFLKFENHGSNKSVCTIHGSGRPMQEISQDQMGKAHNHVDTVLVKKLFRFTE